MWVAGPAASALLGDWGADVVKIEPPEGDAIAISGAGTHQGPSLPGDELGSGADQNPASQCPDANHGLWSACAYGGGQSTGSRRGPQGHGRLTPLPTRKNRSHHAPSTTHTRVRRRTYVRILELSSQLIQEDAGARPHPLL